MNTRSHRCQSNAPLRTARASAILGCALLAVALCNPNAAAAPGLPLAKPEKVGMSSERLERIGAVMQKYIDAGLVPGTVTLVARRGKVVHLEARGYRDVEAQAPMTPDVIFRIASMTKPVTSVALMMLFEEGHFLLSDPISKWLPEFSDMQVAVPTEGSVASTPYTLTPAIRPITVKHILTHTAGFPNNYRLFTRDVYREISKRRSPDETIGDYVTRLATLPLNFQPGEKWEYSGATNVVGRLVEIISGMTLDEFFRERIFEPLGMPDTHFYLPEAKLARFPSLYRPGEDGKIELVSAPSPESRYVKEPHVYFRASGGLVSTVADYFRFHQMMLNGGELEGVRLLGRKTVELMTKNHIGDKYVWLAGPGVGFGLGYSVILDSGIAGSSSTEGSYAWGGAFCTSFWVDPVEKLIGIFMTQVRPYGHINIRQEFANVVNQAIID